MCTAQVAVFENIRFQSDFPGKKFTLCLSVHHPLFRWMLKAFLGWLMLGTAAFVLFLSPG